MLAVLQWGEFYGEEDAIPSIRTSVQDPTASQGPVSDSGHGRAGQAYTKLPLSSFPLHSFSTQRLPETEAVSSCLVTIRGFSSFGLNRNFSVTSCSKE